MATKRKRGGTFFYTVKKVGLLPKPLNLSFKDEQEGDAYVERLEKLLAAGVVPPEFAEKAGAIVTVADAIREYRRVVSVGKADRPLLDMLAGDGVGAHKALFVDYAWAERWVTRMKREERLAPSTIRHRVGALARCYDWLARKGELHGNPFRLLPKGYASYTEDDERVLAAEGKVIREDVSRDRRLEDGEEASIRRILSGDTSLKLAHRECLEFLFALELETGMRLREIFTLERSQLDVRRKTIFLDKTKNGHKRQVPLSPRAIWLCSDYVKRMKYQGRLFPWLREDWMADRALRDRELSRVTALLSRQFVRIFTAAGCDDLTFHDLRHEATCRLYENTDLSDVEVAKIMGWSSLRMAMRYANLRGSHLADRLR
jgi:integrase